MIQPRVRKVLLAWAENKSEIHIDPTSGGLFVGGNEPIVADAGKANACIRQMLDANLVEPIAFNSTTYQITERGANEAGEESHRRDMLRATGMKIPGLLHKNIPSGKAVLFSVAVRTAMHDVELLNLAYRLSDDGCDVDDVSGKFHFRVNNEPPTVEALLHKYGTLDPSA